MRLDRWWIRRRTGVGKVEEGKCDVASGGRRSGKQAGRQAAGSGSLSRAARLRRATAVSVRVCDANAGAAER